MNYNEFLKVLTPEDKKDFEKYSRARGPQAYIIVLGALGEDVDSNTIYRNVSQIIRYDKGLKDLLFRYLGFMEETIKTYIFRNYDFKSDIDEVEEYKYAKQLNGIVERKSISDGDITNLYKKFKLSFGDIKLFLNNENDQTYDENLLENMRLLRNEVMHHRMLLFDYDSKYIGNNTFKMVIDFIKLLPSDFAQYLIDDLFDYTNKKMTVIDEKYHKYLLFKSKDVCVEC